MSEVEPGEGFSRSGSYSSAAPKKDQIMTDLEMLAAIRTQALTTIAAITADPKPSYAIDGQTVRWAEYLAQLQATVDWCDARLSADEPFEIRSQGLAG